MSSMFDGLTKKQWEMLAQALDEADAQDAGLSIVIDDYRIGTKPPVPPKSDLQDPKPDNNIKL